MLAIWPRSTWSGPEPSERACVANGVVKKRLAEQFPNGSRQAHAPGSGQQVAGMRGAAENLRRHARRANSVFDPRTIVLCLANARLGALRFQDPRTGRFLTSTGRPVPPLVGLPHLLAAARRVLWDAESGCAKPLP